jgi:hypothetical protein
MSFATHGIPFDAWSACTRCTRGGAEGCPAKRSKRRNFHHSLSVELRRGVCVNEAQGFAS